MAHYKAHWLHGCRLGKNDGLRLGFSLIHSAKYFLNYFAKSPDFYCSVCATKARLALAKESAPKPDPRSDSERYAELRKLVEAWQSAYHQNDKAQTKDHPITEGWLKHWLNFCDAQKPLLDWSHR